MENKNFWQQEAFVWEGFALDRQSHWSKRSHFVLRQLKELIPTPGRSLDLGCGPGYLCSLLADCGFDAYGVDISENMLSRARRRDARVHFARGDEKELPFSENQFDLITAFGLLEYIENRRLYLSRVVELLAPGGILVLSNSNRLSLFVILAVISRILRWPWHFGEDGWRQTIINLGRSGIWTGGMINLDRAEPICSAAALDRQARARGLERVAFFGMFNFPWIDRYSRLRSLQKSAVGRWLLRHLAWNYIAFYRKPGLRNEI